MQITMDTAQVNVAVQPNGVKLLVVTDVKSGIQVLIPLPPESARTIGAALSTRLNVAGAPLPPTNGPGVH